MARRVKSIRDQFDFSKGTVQLGGPTPGPMTVDIRAKEPEKLDRMGGFGPAEQPAAPVQESGPAPLVAPQQQQAQPEPVAAQISRSLEPLSAQKPQASIRKPVGGRLSRLRMPTFRRG